MSASLTPEEVEVLKRASGNPAEGKTMGLVPSHLDGTAAKLDYFGYVEAYSFLGITCVKIRELGNARLQEHLNS